MKPFLLGLIQQSPQYGTSPPKRPATPPSQPTDLTKSASKMPNMAKPWQKRIQSLRRWEVMKHSGALVLHLNSEFSWFFMIYDDLWWFVMIYDDLQGFRSSAPPNLVFSSIPNQNGMISGGSLVGTYRPGPHHMTSRGSTVAPENGAAPWGKRQHQGLSGRTPGDHGPVWFGHPATCVSLIVFVCLFLLWIYCAKLHLYCTDLYCVSFPAGKRLWFNFWLTERWRAVK